VKFGQWLGFICLIMALYVLWQIRQLLLLIFMAIVFTVALNRCVKGLQRLGIKRGLAILITLLTSLGIVIVFFIIIVPPFIEQFQKLIELLPQAWDLVRNNSIQWRQQFQFDWLPPLPNLTDLVQQLQPLGTFVFSNFFTFFSNSVAAILQLLFVLVLAMMMLANPQPYRQAFLKLFPNFYRRRAEEILTLSEAGLGNWLLGIAISSTMVGLFSGFGLWVLQINLVLVHAILAGLLNFIPNIGPTASVIFPIYCCYRCTLENCRYSDSLFYYPKCRKLFADTHCHG